MARAAKDKRGMCCNAIHLARIELATFSVLG